jgi:hypothetical protein
MLSSVSIIVFLYRSPNGTNSNTSLKCIIVEGFGIHFGGKRNICSSGLKAVETVQIKGSINEALPRIIKEYTIILGIIFFRFIPDILLYSVS